MKSLNKMGRYIRSEKENKYEIIGRLNGVTNMKIIYIADDGKEFDNEFDCERYEWELKHPLNGISFYDKNNNELGNIFSTDTYCTTEKVVVSNESALKSLKEFADYTGFCCYHNIKECGEWVFNDDEETFVKLQKEG